MEQANLMQAVLGVGAGVMAVAVAVGEEGEAVEVEGVAGAEAGAGEEAARRLLLQATAMQAATAVRAARGTAAMQQGLRLA